MDRFPLRPPAPHNARARFSGDPCRIRVLATVLAGIVLIAGAWGDIACGADPGDAAPQMPASAQSPGADVLNPTREAAGAAPTTARDRSPAVTQDHALNDLPVPQAIADLVRRCVEPQAWNPPDACQYVPPATLRVRQSPEVQAAVTDFLALLRFHGLRLSFNFTGTPLAQVATALSRLSGLSVELSRDVKPKAPSTSRSAPWTPGAASPYCRSSPRTGDRQP